MKFPVLITLMIFFSLAMTAQENNGYYGKKIFVQVEGLGNYPLFSNLFNNGNYGYASEGNYLRRKKDNFNYGYRLNAGYAIKRNIALSFEFGQDFSSVYPDEDQFVYDGFYGYTVQHEMVDVATSVFIPKIEFGTSNALLPMGLSHQIGFGVAFSKLIEKDYLYRYYSFESYQNYSTPSAMVDPIRFENLEKVRKYVLMYALSMRTPISKSVMINYGIKYTLNIGKPDFQSYSDVENEYYTYAVLYRTAKHRYHSFINANVGITYVF